MSAPTYISPDQLLDNLRLLCAHASSVGHDHELAQTAGVVQRLMQRSGLETRLISTAGAPVVIGERAGMHPFTLLLYHHYDAAPIGPWRAWYHDPLTLSEREHNVYARGVSLGKGPLAAHLSALSALISLEQTLPCNVIVVAEGEGLAGSPQLAEALAAAGVTTRADACLASAGERDERGWPYCYSGSKGVMRVRLRATGAPQPLAPGLATILPNPLWRLIWALNSIKGEDEDIKINGFYDSVEGPSHATSRALRKLTMNEADRLAAWGLPQFLFGMSGGGLTSAETTLPTCNVSALTVEPLQAIDAIPTEASAMLDFQLVPQQQPDAINALLKDHLEASGFSDIHMQLLPGCYGAACSPDNTTFVQQLARVGSQVYDEPLTILPMGPFAVPLQLLQNECAVPVASLGCARPDSGTFTVNEHASLDDLLRHGQLLIELIWACSSLAETVQGK